MAGGMSSLRLPQNRKWRIAIIVGMLCLTAWIVWRIADDEPRYQGHGLRHWYELAHSTNATEQTAGVEALRAIGTNAVPYLVKKLGEYPSKLDKWIWDVSNGRLKLPATFNHDDAVETLVIIGPDAASATPALLRSNKNPTFGISTPPLEALAVISMGPKAFPHIGDALFDTDKATRESAMLFIHAFILLHPQHEIRKEVLRGLQSPDQGIRDHCIRALPSFDHIMAAHILREAESVPVEITINKLSPEDKSNPRGLITVLKEMRIKADSKGQKLIDEIVSCLERNASSAKLVINHP
jgi:hypothetical protein